MSTPLVNNFLRLDTEATEWSRAKAGILPAGLERTTGFQFGTQAAPAAVLKASQHLELFNPQTQKDLSQLKVLTLAGLDFENCNMETALSQIEQGVSQLLDSKIFPVILGGEHTVSLPAVNAIKKSHSDFCVLQIDAHTCLKDSFEGSRLSHACVMRRICEAGIFVGNLGARSYSQEEFQFIQSHPELYKILSPENFTTSLKPKVYVSIDLDFLDPSICPGVSRPESNGARYSELLKILESVFKNHEVVGLDLVELRPKNDDSYSEYLAAQVVARCLEFKYL